MEVDKINGIFEVIGAFFVWKNVTALYRDKVIKGVYWPATAFFAVWGLWNLVYYPSLNQWWSFLGGIALVSGSITWVILALGYRSNE